MSSLIPIIRQTAKQYNDRNFYSKVKEYWNERANVYKDDLVVARGISDILSNEKALKKIEAQENAEAIFISQFIKEKASLADSGAGNGNMLFHVIKYKNEKCFALDLSERLLVRLRERSKKFNDQKIFIIQGNAKELTLKNNSFDSVICLGVI